MPHRRSMRARQRRAVKRYMVSQAYQDREKGETVNLLKPEQINEFLKNVFDFVHVDLTRIPKGLVLVDSRGEGTLQK